MPAQFRPDQRSVDLAAARAELHAELKSALFSDDLGQKVSTPGGPRKQSTALEVVALELTGTEREQHTLVTLLRDASRGEDVTLRAQLLLSIALNEHAAAHADALALDADDDSRAYDLRRDA